jgi:hypothetical protein
LKWKLETLKLSKMNKDGLEWLWLEHQHKEAENIVVSDI